MQTHTIESTKLYRASPPFLLEGSATYTEAVLRNIFSKTNPEKARELNSKTITYADIDSDKYFIQLAVGHQNKLNEIIIKLNDLQLRKIEIEIINLINTSYNEFKNFQSYYETFSIITKRPMNKTIREFREFFGGYSFKKILSPSEASKLIWKEWDTPPSPGHYYGVEGHFHLNELNEYFNSKLEKEQFRQQKKDFLLKDYIEKTSSLSSLQDILYTPVKLTNGEIKYVACSTYTLVKPIIEEMEKKAALEKSMNEALLLNQRIQKEREAAEKKERQRILELFNKKNPFANIELGGDTYLYYIRIKYKNRKKFCYKIGITIKPDLRMRFPGKNYRNIDKILFFEKVVNAPEIEAQILRLFEEHAFPVNIFEDYGGHTEIFDHDVLRLDDGS